MLHCDPADACNRGSRRLLVQPCCSWNLGWPKMRSTNAHWQLAMRTLPRPHAKTSDTIKQFAFSMMFPDCSYINWKESRCFFQHLPDSRWADECMAKAFFTASPVYFRIFYPSTPKTNTNEERPLTDLRHIRVRCIRPRDRPSCPRRPMSRRWRSVAQAQQTRSPFGAWSFLVVASAVTTPLTCWGQDRPKRCELWPKTVDFGIHHSMFEITIFSCQSSCAVQASSGKNYCKFEILWAKYFVLCMSWGMLRPFSCSIEADCAKHPARVWEGGRNRWKLVGVTAKAGFWDLLLENCWEVWNTYGSSAGSGSCSIPIYYKHRRIELASWQAQINYNN